MGKRPSSFNQTTSVAPFGGCLRLDGQYRIIGLGLSAIEEQHGRFGRVTRESQEQFHTTVAFLPVEVLESYLEDLLEVGTSSEQLYLKRDSVGRWLGISAFLGLAGALVAGLWNAASGASLLLSFLLSVLIASPFAIVWHLSSKESYLRRLRLARVVSQEISSRRGSGADSDVRRVTTLLPDLFSARSSTTRSQGSAAFSYDA